MPSPNSQNRARKAAHRPGAPAPHSPDDGFQPQASFIVEFGALPSGGRATGIHHVEADRSARFDGYDVQGPAFWMLRRLPAEPGGATRIVAAIDPSITSQSQDADVTPEENADIVPFAAAPTEVPRHRFECTEVALTLLQRAGAQPLPLLDPNAWVSLKAADSFTVSLRVGLAMRLAGSATDTRCGDPQADRAGADHARATRPVNALLQLAPLPHGDARILACQTRTLPACGFTELAWGVAPLAPGQYDLIALVFADDAWAVPTQRRLARLVVVK